MTDAPADMSSARASKRQSNPHFGIEAELQRPAERLRQLDLLRVGSFTDVRHYLDQHLHSDRFYVDGDRIWLELPNRIDAPPDRALLVWFRVPRAYSVASPSAGTRLGLHAVPDGWDATLCRIPTSSWTSGSETYPERQVTCRWCELRLVAAELATGSPVARGNGY
jgi:hypothetical protein